MATTKSFFAKRFVDETPCAPRSLPWTFELADALHANVIIELVRAYYASDGLHFEEGAIRRGVDILLRDGSLGGIWLITSAGERVGYFIVTFGYDLEFGGRCAAASPSTSDCP